jgi:ATP-dependent helicase/nuclease subunit B
MAVAVTGTAYGNPAMTALSEVVGRAKSDDPLRRVTVVVPSNFVAVAVRRWLAGPGSPRRPGGGVAGLSVLTLPRLADLLGGPRLAANGLRPLSTPVLGAAVRAVLADEPGLFGPIADHPATERALVEAHRELRELDDYELDAVAACGARAADVIRVHRATRSRLSRDWYDEQDVVAAAIWEVADDGPLLGDLGTVVVHLPQRIAPGAGRLVASLAERVPVSVVVGLTGSARADHGVVTAMQRLGAALEGESTFKLKSPAGTAIVTASDADDEVRAAVRAVFDGLRAGVPLARMALLYASREPHARLVHEQLVSAGIPHNGAGVRSVGDALLGRSIRALLALPDRDYERRDVLALLGAAPMRGPDGRLIPAAAWERISRAAGVVAGASQWEDRLAFYADERRAEADRAEADERATLAAYLRDEADRADGLRTFVGELIREVERGAQPAPWATRCAWVAGLVELYIGDEDSRVSWPEEEQAAAHRVEAAIERLACLERVEQTPPSLDVFRRTLEAELADELDRIGTLGRGLLVGHVGLGLGLDLDRVFVLGLAEGMLPRPYRDDSLLPDAERAAAGGALELRSERIHVEHRQLLAALAAASDVRILFHPRGDLRRSAERVPSRWLLDTAARLSRRDRIWSDELTGLRTQSWMTEIPSFAGALARLSWPATPQEYDTRSLLGHHRSRSPVSDHPLAGDRAFALGDELRRARSSGVFTRFDGNLAGLGVPHPADGSVTSATRLQAWASCPHRYLFETVLGVEQVQAPEDLLELSPLERGEIVHRVLDRFLREGLARRARADGRSWTDDDRRRLLEIGTEECDDAERRGVTGRPLLWRRARRQILGDLARWCDEDLRRERGARSEPVASELDFGLPGSAHGPLELALSDGRVVRLRGSIDRVDRADDGTLVVLDYKTGSDITYRSLSEDDPDTRGTHLQLAIYGHAARAVLGEPDSPVVAGYWFATTRRRFRWIGYPLSDRVVERIDAVLRTIVDGITGGVFPARPPEPGWRLWVECAFCDPDGLGTLDRRLEWERKRQAPELAAYVALAEPAEQGQEDAVGAVVGG